MTTTQDYSTTTIIDEFGSEANYPTAFGITFTPKVSGIALGLLGIVGAGYVLVTFFMPALEQYAKLRLDQEIKQQQIDQQKSGQLERRKLEAEAGLRRAEARREVIKTLYANSTELKTLLLDIQSRFKARQVDLVNFLPQGDPVVIGDDSLGAGAKNKLKRQTYQMTLRGPFGNTQNLIRDLERLQPLILMKDFKVDLAQADIPVKMVRTGNTVQIQPQAEDTLNTSMSIDVLLPLTPEEIAALAPPPPPPGEEGKDKKSDDKKAEEPPKK